MGNKLEDIVSDVKERFSEQIDVISVRYTPTQHTTCVVIQTGADFPGDTDSPAYVPDNVYINPKHLPLHVPTPSGPAWITDLNFRLKNGTNLTLKFGEIEKSSGMIPDSELAMSKWELVESPARAADESTCVIRNYLIAIHSLGYKIASKPF